MLKRFLSILLSLSLLLGCAAAETADAADAAVSVEVEELWSGPFERRLFPLYVSVDNTKPEDVPVYLMKDAEDLPFMDLMDWIDLMDYLFNDEEENPVYQLKAEPGAEPDQFVLVRENGGTILFDFNEGNIFFDDYRTATIMPNETAYRDPVFEGIFRQDGKPGLISLVRSQDRRGEITNVSLKEYGIPMLVRDGKYLIPLQTLMGLFFNHAQYGIYFNGEALFLADITAMKEPLESFMEQLENSDQLPFEIYRQFEMYSGPQSEKEQFFLDLLEKESESGKELVKQYRQLKAEDLYTLYTSPGPRMRSEALTEYGYRELCLELNCFYGLKEAHSIQDFNMFLLQTGLYADLLDPDPAKADQAVSDLVLYWLDDGHSSFIGHSWMAAANPEYSLGTSNARMAEDNPEKIFSRLLSSNAEEPYYETGDTAFVTLDSFDLASDGNGIADHYALAEKNELPGDTFSIIIDAHRQITRENSPVRNVVLDLSCNGGGIASAAVYTLCWFLGTASVSIHETFTGSQSTSYYMADVNLDHVYDENDTLAGRGLDLYCLISPESFSCGNLVPWAFKADGKVTLLGRVSGGGSCCVRPFMTAWGTSLQISGSDRISFVKNGSYYDVDRGVEPDYLIRSYENFYDREALAKFIAGLF